MKIPLTVNFIPQLKIAEFDEKIAELLAGGKYHIAPAYIIKEGKYQLVSLSLLPKKIKR